MAVTNNRYCIDDAVINYNYRELTQADVVRQTLNTYIFNNLGFKALIQKIYDYKKIGKSTVCLHEEIAYIQAVIDLFEIIKSEAVCSTDDNFEELEETYKLDCIRDNLACRYGEGNLINDLVDLLGLSGAYNGIGYMTIQATDAEADCSPFQPTQKD